MLTDEYELEKKYAFDKDTIAIFEGIFLFREEFSPYNVNGAGEREALIHGEEVINRYQGKYLPASP